MVQHAKWSKRCKGSYTNEHIANLKQHSEVVAVIRRKRKQAERYQKLKKEGHGECEIERFERCQRNKHSISLKYNKQMRQKSYQKRKENISKKYKELNRKRNTLAGGQFIKFVYPLIFKEFESDMIAGHLVKINDILDEDSKNHSEEALDLFDRESL